jgi:hypothetical protein
MRATIISFLVLIACSSSVQAQLASHAQVTTNQNNWFYTLFNDEATGSSNYVTSFALNINAPIAVVNAPAGWDFQTDNLSYVYWFNTDPGLPYPHDIVPGASLSGFTFQSTSSSTLSDYILAGWDHAVDAPGPSVTAQILSPSNVPEPTTPVVLFSTVVCLLAVQCIQRGNRQRKR